MTATAEATTEQAKPADSEGVQRTSPTRYVVSAQPPQATEQPKPEAQVDLDALLKDPAILQQLNQRLVAPAITKVEFNRQQERAKIAEEIRASLAQEQQDAQIAALIAAADRDDPAGKAAQKQILTMLKSQRATGALAKQQAAQREEAINTLAQNLFGLDPKAIPAEALGTVDSLRAYVAEHSSTLREAYEAQRKKQEADQTAVAGAKGAATYANTLAAMQNPDLSGGVQPGAAATGDYDTIEREFIAGRVSLEAYTTARVKRGLPKTGM